MEAFLAKLKGKRIDVFCGGSASLRGEVVRVEGGVLHLKDEEEQLCYVVIEKIIAVWEARENEHRAGFLSVGFK